MRKQILDALKAKFPGVSDAVLGRIADKIAKTTTNEEDVATAVEGVTLQQVLDSYGDSRATEATQTAVSNYEKKHGLKDGQKVQGGAPASEPGNDTEPGAGGNDIASQITAAVQRAMKPLQDEITTLKAGKMSETRRQQLDAVMANSSDKFKSRTGKNFDRLSFKDEEDFNSWLEDVKTEAEEDVAGETARGTVFGRPKVGQNSGGKDEVPKNIADYLDGKTGTEGQAF